MKTVLIILTCMLLAGPGPVRADTVELNGLACMFGKNLALLVVYQPAQTAPIHFTLSEGEAQFGIKLVQVDTVHRRAEIEQGGVSKYVSLCGVASAGQADGVPLVLVDGKHSLGDISRINAWLSTGGAQLERLKSGADNINFSASGSGAAAAKSQTGGQTGTSGNQAGGSVEGSGTGTAVGNDSSKIDVTREAWYQDSLSIEQSRLLTAQQVLDGDATAWPRTPLTPANTPAQFIGTETFYPNHIPHFVVSGSVNSSFASAN